jgi:hypothetical protein
MHHIPFHEEVWTVPDTVIPGNSEANDPCRFHISMGSDEDFAKLKSIVVGAVGLTPDIRWTSQVQKSVASSFVHGRDAFVRTVDKVEGLTVQAKLARKAGLIPTFVAGSQDISGLPDDSPFPIRTGFQYSRVAPYMIVVSFLLANEIIKLTDRGNVDARFFAPSSGSSTAGQPANSGAVNGTAPSVRPGRASGGTADGQKTQPASRRAGTSRRKK